MGETSDQIERQIRATRDNLSENLVELEERVKSAVDWRAQVEERPGTMLALAFGGGILVSALLPSRRSSGKTNSNEGELPARSHHSNLSLDSSSYDGLDTLDAIKGALVGVAVAKASAFIDEVLPGFKGELAKAQDRRGFRQPEGPPSPKTPAVTKASAVGAD